MICLKNVICVSALTFCFAITSYCQNKPKATYQVGNSKVVVWENVNEGPSGKFITTNYQVEKVYKKDGEWKSTSSFNLTELLELKAAIEKAIGEEGVKTKD